MKRLLFRSVVAAAFLAVVVGTAGLWLSDDVPREMKVQLTVVNALAWGVIVLPAIGVAMWARLQRPPRRKG